MKINIELAKKLDDLRNKLKEVNSNKDILIIDETEKINRKPYFNNLNNDKSKRKYKI